MFILEDLKDNKKEIIEKILSESGRAGAVSFCAGVLDKRAYFTVDMNENIKRKKMNYVIPASVFLKEDSSFIDYIAENIDFAEKTKIDKIERMTNAEIPDLKKNIFKLLAKGDYHFVCKYGKELYFKDKDEFFKMMFQFALMDNSAFEKSLAVYSLKKYFEKFDYSDEAFYLTISYIAKMRADFSDYENAETENKKVSKEELREKFRNNIYEYKTEEGLKILGYLLGLLSYDYENEDKFTVLLQRKMEVLKDSKELTGVSAEIFECLSKEV